LTACGEPNPADPGGGPTPTPMLALAPTRRRSETISSSSVASADEPSTTPFGLGERRTGDTVLSESIFECYSSTKKTEEHTVPIHIHPYQKREWFVSGGWLRWPFPGCEPWIKTHQIVARARELRDSLSNCGQHKILAG
jgi:hypothetical protein